MGSPTRIARALNISVGILISITLVLGLFAVHNFLHIFSGNETQAMELLGVLVQSSSGLIAIVFAFFIFISQTVVGKYVSGTLDYIFNNKKFIILLVFYTIATLIIVLISWIFPNIRSNALLDVAFSLFLIQILLLPILFVFQSKLMSPKTIIDSLLHEVSLKDQKNMKSTMEKIELVFSIIYKLAENREYDGATHGLKSVTTIVTSYPKKEQGLGFYRWVIPNYERIGVECFKFDPNITMFVISQFNEIANHLTQKLPFTLANTCSAIASSCINIATAVSGKPYSERPLAGLFSMLQKIYVSKSLVDYGFSASEELHIMIQIIKMMIKANVPYHWMVGLEFQSNCEKLLKAEKYEMMYLLFVGTLNAFPKNDFVLQEYVNIIFFVVPLNKKELAIELIKGIKEKFGSLDIQLEKTADKSHTEIGGRNGVIRVKTGNEEFAKKIAWFNEK